MLSVFFDALHSEWSLISKAFRETSAYLRLIKGLFVFYSFKRRPPSPASNNNKSLGMCSFLIIQIFWKSFPNVFVLKRSDSKARSKRLRPSVTSSPSSSTSSATLIQLIYFGLVVVVVGGGGCVVVVVVVDDDDGFVVVVVDDDGFVVVVGGGGGCVVVVVVVVDDDGFVVVAVAILWNWVS